MNTALVTKLAWHMATPTHHTWTKLIKAKYLWGKPILDVRQSQATVSWIWGSILNSIKLLRAGSCYQVGNLSSLRIKGTPWLSESLEFRIPADIHIPNNITQIKDLMEHNGTTWNSSLISNIFPMEIRTKILKTPILDKEHEGIVWIPSTLGDFSLKAKHRLIRQLQGDDQEVVTGRNGKQYGIPTFKTYTKCWFGNWCTTLSPH